MTTRVPAQESLDRIYADMQNYDPEERALVNSLVDKLEIIRNVHGAQFDLALMIVSMRIAVSRGM